MEIILYFISFIISAFPALFLSAPPVEDALGTMGFAAYLTGYDFSEFLANDGFFYKYGQSIWYIPMYCLIKNPTVRYKAMLVLNSALDGFITVFAYRISLRYSQKKYESFAAALVTGLMPAVLLNSKYTWAEPVLMLTPWVVIMIMIKLSDYDKDAGAGFKVQSGLLSWAAVYGFMSHQRGIVMVIATIMTVLIYRAVFGKRLVHGPIFAINLMAAILLDRFLNFWLRENVYLGIAPKYNTLASFLNPETYRKMFSLQGLKVLFATITGWLFNVSVSGLGITLLGLFAMIFAVFAVKKQALRKDTFVFSLFGTLLFMGSFLLGILFFFNDLYDYWVGVKVTRCDHLVFGRYLESSLSIIMFAGIFFLIFAKDAKKKALKKTSILTLAFMIFAVTYYTLKIAPEMVNVDSYVHSLMPMNYIYDMDGVSLTRDMISNLPKALTVAGIIGIVSFVAVTGIMINKKQGAFIFACTLLILIFGYVYVRSFSDIVLRIDRQALTTYAQYYLSHG